MRDALARLLLADPVEQLPVKRPRLPALLRLEDLPAPLLADRSAKLPRAAVGALVTLLSFSTLEAPHAGLAQVRTACEPASLARFVWALFEVWLARGAPAEEGWCLQALGLLGDDDTARRLTPLLRQWPGESAHARAVTSLDVLVALGTDVALVYLHGLAQKANMKAGGPPASHLPTLLANDVLEFEMDRSHAPLHPRKRLRLNT